MVVVVIMMVVVIMVIVIISVPSEPVLGTENEILA
jgi:hypothetical protein